MKLKTNFAPPLETWVPVMNALIWGGAVLLVAVSLSLVSETVRLKEGLPELHKEVAALERRSAEIAPPEPVAAERLLAVKNAVAQLNRLEAGLSTPLNAQLRTLENALPPSAYLAGLRYTPVSGETLLTLEAPSLDAMPPLLQALADAPWVEDVMITRQNQGTAGQRDIVRVELRIRERR